jgi:N-acetylglutamate synthase-like GNAT family acetyltransferase
VAEKEKLAIIVRRPTESDIISWANNLMPDLNVETVKRHWQEHLDCQREVLIVEIAGNVVGSVATTIYCQQLPNSMRMFSLNVGAAFRRRGVGTALMGGGG